MNYELRIVIWIAVLTAFLVPVIVEIFIDKNKGTEAQRHKGTEE